MTLDFERICSDIRSFRFRSSEAADWQRFFDDAIQLLDSPDLQHKHNAINRITTGLWAESRERSQIHGAVSAEERLTSVLSALAKRTDDFDFYLINFAHFGPLGSNDSEYHEVFSRWLEDVSDSGKYPSITADATLIARLESGLFARQNWDQAKEFIIPNLSHKNDTVRACAAGAVARLYGSDASNLPAPDDMLDQIMKWDIERPGVAGPFWSEFGNQGHHFSTDIESWMLKIIAERKGEEPDVECYNAIDFHAHEVLSGNPNAIRKLMDCGAESVAVMAATEIDRPIEAMRQILIELGDSKDEFVRRLACWHLAYHYHYLHPAGKEHGLVRLEQAPDADVFFVFQEGEERPYSAAVYPREETIEDSAALVWLSKLTSGTGCLPDKKDFEKQVYMSADELSFDLGSRRVVLHGDTAKREWNNIMVRWPRYKQSAQSET